MSPLALRLREALLTASRRSGAPGYSGLGRRHSDGFEFAELREYQEGDDPRRIDWAASARAGALQSRVLIEERSLLLAAIVDGSASMRVGLATSNYARARAAARQWHAMAGAGDRCAWIDAGRFVMPTGLSGGPAAHACDRLEAPEHGSPGEALAAALAALPRDAHLLVVSDFFDLPTLEPRLRTAARRFDVTALLATDPWNGELPLGGFVRLRDAETEETETLFIGSKERARYRAAVERRERESLRALAALGVRAAALDQRGAPAALFAALRSAPHVAA